MPQRARNGYRVLDEDEVSRALQLEGTRDGLTAQERERARAVLREAARRRRDAEEEEAWRWMD